MIFLLVLAGIILIFGIRFYNSLVISKNTVSSAFATIDVMLKKRFDLIPNLVETVKQYTNHEHDTLTEIAGLRSQALLPSATEGDKLRLDQRIGSSMRGLMMNSENYPELKADQHFRELQATWTESEEQIAAARRNYNYCITTYNNKVMMFPGNMFAGMLGYSQLALLETPAEERQNISAKALFNN